MVVRVGINGFGTIGKRVAEAVIKQPDMELVGVVKVTPDYNALVVIEKNIPLYTIAGREELFRERGMDVRGVIDDLLEDVDVVVDTTPPGYGQRYKSLYKRFGVKAVFQGGEKPEVADLSFSSLCNYVEALGKESVRVVSCNTTGLLRLVCSLDGEFGVESVRATIIRRACDPKEVKRGPVNAIVPNPASIPSHHGVDVKTVLPWLDIVTTAVVVPTTLMHVHSLVIRFREAVSLDRVVDALASSPRIVLVDSSLGLKSTAEIVELARDIGRMRYDIPELIVWRDSLYVNGRELMLLQTVHQESIVIPENIDAIRAVTETERDPWKSIELTDKTLGLKKEALWRKLTILKETETT